MLVNPTDAETDPPITSLHNRSQPESSSSIYWSEEEGPPLDVEAFMERCDALSDDRVYPKIADVTVGRETEHWAFRRECLYPADETYVCGHATPPLDMELPRRT